MPGPRGGKQWGEVEDAHRKALGRPLKTTITAKQARFLDEYLVDMNATQAAIRAGYAPKNAKVTACRLLTKANICAELKRRRESLQAQSELTAVSVLKALEGLYEIALKKSKLGDAIRAVELIGKHLGMFTGKIEQEGDVIIKVFSNIPGAPGSRIQENDEDG